MKKLIYIPFLIILVVSLASCEQTKIKQEQISEVDSIILQLEDLKDTVSKIHFDSIAIYANDMAYDKLLIKKYFHSDTVNEALARKINRFNGIRKQFKKYSGKGITFETKIDSCLAQVNRLKTDISAGAGNKEKYNEYVHLEQGNLNKLNTEFEMINSNTQRNLKEFKELSPFVKNFIEEIKKID